MGKSAVVKKTKGTTVKTASTLGKAVAKSKASASKKSAPKSTVAKKVTKVAKSGATKVSKVASEARAISRAHSDSHGYGKANDSGSYIKGESLTSKMKRTSARCGNTRTGLRKESMK